MSYQEVTSLDCDNAVQLGGKDRKTGKANPTRIEGYYIGSRDVASPKSKTGFSKLHVFQTAKGNEGVWGKTDLDRKLASAALGVMTRVTYTGMKETKNNPMYVYKVEVDAENSIDVGTASEPHSFGNEAETEYDDAEEVDAGEEEAALDEAPPARAAAPRQPAQAPSAERQNKVKALLAGRKQA
jgi:hypothetical protein